MSVIYIACDNEIATTTALTAGGAALTTATVTWALKTVAGSSVATGSLTHSSGGAFSGTIESSQITTITKPGSRYFLDITIVQGSFNDFRRMELVSAYRNGDE